MTCRQVFKKPSNHEKTPNFSVYSVETPEIGTI
jgi:hypothetical protein